jgi:hypothetical protein
MSLNAKDAAIAHLTAENARLAAENVQLTAHHVIDAEHIRRLLAAIPVPKPSYRSLAEVQP